MNNLKRIAVVAILALSWTMIGCSDSSTTGPTTVKNYLPLSSGSYWIYNRQTIDTATHDFSGPVHVDSAYVMDSVSYHDKGTFRVVYVQLDSNRRDTTYLSKGTNGEIYTYLDFNVAQLKALAPTLVAPATWVKVKGSSSESSWTSVDTTIANIPFTIPGLGPVTLTLKFKVSGATGTTKDITVAGKSYTATEYVLTFSITDTGGLASYTQKQHFWFVENVGIVQSRTDDAQMASLAGPLLKVNGTQSDCQRFSIK